MCFIKLQDHKKPWLSSVLNHENHEKTRKIILITEKHRKALKLKLRKTAESASHFHLSSSIE